MPRLVKQALKVVLPSTLLAGVAVVVMVAAAPGSSGAVPPGTSLAAATTAAATITQTTTPCPPTTLGIFPQPASQTVTAGQSATFTAVGSQSDCPVTVQWYVSTDGGAMFSAIPGAMSDSLVIPNTAVAESGDQYYALFTSPSVSVRSQIVTLTVDPAATMTTTTTTTTTTRCMPSTLDITDPTSQTVTVGQSATFTTAVTTDCPSTVQWFVSADGGVTYSAIQGATSDSLGVPDTTLAESGDLYFAVFSLPSYSYRTRTATLTVNPATSTVTTTRTTTTVCPPETLGITEQPASQTVTAGQTATFTGAADEGLCTLTTQWFVSTDGGNTFNAIPGATSSSLVIPNTTVSESGNEYYALFSSADGSLRSMTVTLTVNPPTTPPPAVTWVFPSSGSTAGGLALILGRGFRRASSVAFGMTKARFYFVLTDRLIITIVPPQAAGTVDVTVTGPTGTSATSSADQYTYVSG